MMTRITPRITQCGPALLTFCLLAAAAAPSHGVEPKNALPKASIFFDGHTMRLADATANEAMTLMEFVPDGQTLDTWTSLAAIYSYHNARIGPRKRADALVAQIRKTHPESPVSSIDSPDARQSVVSFALWSEGEKFVEFSVFAFGTSDDTDIGLQYSVRTKSSPEAFLQRDIDPLRDRLVKLILREGMQVSHEQDLTTIRLKLSPAEQAICDTILKDEAEGLKAVLDRPEERSSLVLFVASAVAFNAERLEDSAFLFYCGQLRLRFDEQCFPPKRTDDHDPIRLIQGYSLELGAKINPAVMNEPPHFSRVLARVARWRPRVPSEYSPGYEFGRRLTEEDARVAAEPNRVEFLSRMGDFAALLGDEGYFAATQVVKGLRLPREDRLPTKEEYRAAIETMSRIAKEKGFDAFITPP